jgi:CHAT domain-containing protein
LRVQAWQPVEKYLSGVRRLYVAPEGRLSLVPFEALAQLDDEGKWRYLAEERELIYLGTGRDLGRLAQSVPTRPRQPGTAVLIGNPAFGAEPQDLARVVAALTVKSPIIARSDSSPGPSTLGAATPVQDRRLQVPRTWAQIDALGELIDHTVKQLKKLGWSVTALTNQSAVVEAALSVQAPRILQFATHGYILDRPAANTENWGNPLLRSMLLMAGVNKWQPGNSVFYKVGKEVLSEAQARARGLSEEQLHAARLELADGILTAYDVTGMDLRDTELVNLTACETGLGEVTPDGIAGLRQAFLLAGARALTMSMWQVPAQETTSQIADFYDRWLGVGKARGSTTRYEAFRAAQLAALARTRETRGAGHPFYWAGTIFVGDPGDLPAAGTNLSHIRMPIQPFTVEPRRAGNR